MKIFIAITLLFPMLLLAGESFSLVGEMNIAGNIAKLTIKNDKKSTTARVVPRGEKEGCLFQIDRITAPVQTRGFDGIIMLNKDDSCTLKDQFWNALVLLDIDYRFYKDGEIKGNVRGKVIEKTHKGTVSFKIVK